MDNDIVIDEKHVHGPNFFDEFPVTAVQPEYLVKALLLRDLGCLE
jgi:hypothetical protein